ncbi:MAG TPA: glycosyltransferase family 4 protein [Bacteroidia bacterium]|jgi:glycosyltransferase involved in cell wall biosynthesis
MDKDYIVGTNSLDYNPKRNFGGLPFRSFTVKKKLDLFRMFDFIYFKLKNRSHPFFSNSFFDFGLNKVDVFHFFNAVPITNKPWIVTFENEIPRPYLRSPLLVRQLTQKNCRKIIAFCDRARQIEVFLLDKYPEIRNMILEKLIVIQPSQKLYVQSVNEKNYTQPVTFTFVGVDFFRKGGADILKVADELIKEGLDFRLNIVSQLKKGGWKDEHVKDADIDEVKRFLELNKAVISHYYSLPSDKIIELFKQSNVGLLPSYGETYGYAVLEAQACGCPVITTIMPPFPEFNSNAFGWLIDVPLKKRNGILDSDLSGENLIRFKEALFKGLYQSMKEAITNKDLLKTKSQAAIEHIRNDHSPEKKAQQIEEIYLNAIHK